MKNNKHELYNDPWERDWYETGSTKPPKDRAGLIALLLMLVIAFGGIATVLGIMNVRLFQLLEAQKSMDMTHLASDGIGTISTEDFGLQENSALSYLGMEGQTVSQFDRRFYQLPYGYLVTAVTENCCAQQAGIRSGDVIVAVESTAVRSCQELTGALEQLEAGQSVTLKIYRRQLDRELSVTIVIPEENP